MSEDGSARPRGLRWVLRQPVNAVADTLVPAVMDAVDLDEAIEHVDVNHVLARLDVNGLARRVDLQALLESVDLNAVLDDVDLSRVLARLDLDALLRGIDVDRLLDRMDVNGLLDRVDVDRLLDRVDVDRLLDRVDVDGLIDRVDVDRLVARADLDRLLDRVDLGRVTERLELSSVISRSTGGLLSSLLDALRRQVVGLDVLTLRGIDRLLRRRGRLPEGPESLVRPEVGGGVSGRYVGPISRLLAFGADVAIAGGLFALGVAVSSWVATLVTGHGFSRSSGLGWTLLLVAWELVYFWASWSVAGRSVGMAIVGLRIVSVDGSTITARQALERIAAYPFSFVLMLGFLVALVQRERRALPDLVARTCVVYDWGDRPAEMPGPLTRWLSTRGVLGSSG
ncbi:MAG TPA: RDD family protein [Acidimicrobiales bacterium]|nr:RDD family protein [Acidimicrobiales bacterium]